MATTQMLGEARKKWFQGTTDVVRQFIWVFKVKTYDVVYFLKNTILIYRVVNVVLHDLPGCQEQGCGGYIDTLWGSSLPNGLYGLCTKWYKFSSNITTHNIYSFLKLILILMGTMIAYTC